MQAPITNYDPKRTRLFFGFLTCKTSLFCGFGKQSHFVYKVEKIYGDLGNDICWIFSCCFSSSLVWLIKFSWLDWLYSRRWICLCGGQEVENCVVVCKCIDQWCKGKGAYRSCCAGVACWACGNNQRIWLIR